MRPVLLGSTLFLVTLCRAMTAQTVVTAGAGRTMYDAGGDLAYPSFVASVSHAVSPSISVGAITSYTFVGSNYLSGLAIHNEGVVRAYGLLTLSQPVLMVGGAERWPAFSVYGGIGAGYVRSSWERTVGTASPESLALRSRSGLGFGGLVGIELRPRSRVVVRLQPLGMWLDFFRGRGRYSLEVDQYLMVGYRL